MMNNTKRRIWSAKRAMSLFCVLALLFGMLPMAAVMADEKVVYGRVNHDEVRFRRQANSTVVWANLDAEWVCEIRGEKRSGGTDYYYVVTNIPKHLDREYYGYISQEYITLMTDAEVSAWISSGGNGGELAVDPPADDPSQDSGDVSAPSNPAVLTSYVQPKNDSTNYYSYNGNALSSLGLLNASEAYYMSGTATIGTESYYIILVNGVSCYVKASNMTQLTSGGAPVTPEESDEPEDVQPQPTADISSAIGRIRISLEGRTNFRETAAMISGNVIRKLDQDTELPYFKTVESASNTWYYCYDEVSGEYGYILQRCAVVIASYAPSEKPSDPVQPEVTPSPTPVPGTNTGAVLGYVRITPEGKTNIRRTTRTNSNNVVAKAEQGDVLPYYASSVVNGATWYYVYYAPKDVFGYVLGKCCERTDSTGATAAPTAAPVVTPTPDGSTIIGYVRFTSGGVNLRKTASMGAKVLGRFDKNEVTPYYKTEEKNGKIWYFVHQEDEVGYVHGDYCQPCTIDGTFLPDGSTGSGTSTQGYVMTTADKVYVRKKAQSGSSTLGQVKKEGTILPIVGATVQNGSVQWYCVSFENEIGYIHGNYVSVLNQDQVDAYLNGKPMPTPTPSPTPAPKPTDYIEVTKDKVWIRQSPSTKAKTDGQANKGAVFQYTEFTTVGGTKWCRIKIGDRIAYIMGKYCRVMTDAEYNDYVASLPTPRVTPSPKPEDWSTTALTNTEKVIVRADGAPNAKQLALLYKPNQVCTLLGATKKSGEYTWYNVRVNGTTGWIRGDLLRILTKEQAAVFEKTGDPEARPEASYTTLQLGATGEAVTKLQLQLIHLGYMAEGTATGVYNSATAEAIRKYQTDYELTVDGIANSPTQHSIFGTVETGYYDNNGSSTSVTLYKPELIDWYKGGIQKIFYRGCIATLTDVKTGISFKIKRWAGGDHADVEPLTAADTAAMCKVYGVDYAQEIEEKNLWQRRAVLITIGNRSFAASMFGFPHNYPEGDTIDDNDFNGQFCIHFVNSKTHGTDRVDSDHQKAIMYAYNNAEKLLGIK